MPDHYPVRRHIARPRASRFREQRDARLMLLGANTASAYNLEGHNTSREHERLILIRTPGEA